MSRKLMSVIAVGAALFFGTAMVQAATIDVTSPPEGAEPGRDIDIIHAAVSSVDAQRMYRIMDDLADVNALAKHGRYAGENVDSEDYILESFAAMGLISNKQAFEYLFTKTHSASIRLFKKSADGSFTEDKPLLPRLTKEPVDWNDPPVSLDEPRPYASPLYDSAGEQVMANWEYRDPIPGIDFTVLSRTGAVAAEKVEIATSWHTSIDPHRLQNKIFLDADSDWHYVNVKHAYDNGAKGYISRIAHTPLIAEFFPGWLSQDRYGEVLQEFAQISISGFMESEFKDRVLQGGCFIDINIDATAEHYGRDSGRINNVIAEIPGDVSSSYRDEVVLVSAHFDGQGTQPGAYETTGDPATPLAYPSVNDNASGVAVMMEIAKVISDAYRQGWKPARTIRFVGLNAEEMWYTGAEEYLKNLGKDGRNKIVAAINFDILIAEAIPESGAAFANILNHVYLWDILSQALSDAQLDSLICLQKNINSGNAYKPSFAEECEGKFFRYVAPTGIGPSKFEAGKSDNAGWWVDMFAFKDYALPGINVGIAVAPRDTSVTDFYRHNPFDNLINNTALGWQEHMTNVAKLVAAAVLELGMIEEPLTGR